MIKACLFAKAFNGISHHSLADTVLRLKELHIFILFRPVPFGYPVAVGNIFGLAHPVKSHIQTHLLTPCKSR